MSQFSKVVCYGAPQVAQKSSDTKAARADNKFSLNPGAPAFVPSQALMNDQSDFVSAELKIERDPQTPAFVVPSQSYINERIDFGLTRHIPEPPGLERRRSPSPDRMSTPSQSSLSDTLPQPMKIRANSGDNHGPKGSARAGAPGGKCSGRPSTMKAQLEALQLEDHGCIFIVRGTNKLGFSSPKILRAYFSYFGKVKRVYVSHSRVKSMHRGNSQSPADQVHFRLRAAPLAFITMKSAEAAARILAEGELDINGVAVRVAPFQTNSDTKVTIED